MTAETLKRNSLIEQLSKVRFCAAPTVLTFDMGLQYDYITSEGAGTNLGAFGEWPAYKFRKIEDEKWSKIKRKAINGILTPDDFVGSELEYLSKNMREHHQNYYDDFAKTFSDIKNLPDILPDYFYCIFDIRSWDEQPMFYDDIDLMLEDFQEEYCWCVTEWEEMDCEELQNWLYRTANDLSSFPFTVFSVTTEEEIGVEND